MTKIIGILNITPDSYFDQGRFFNIEKALKQAACMIENGAEILDIGGESTRPFASLVPLEEELKRVIPVIKEIKKQFPNIPISIDTYKAEVAKNALHLGVEIINDITGYGPKMLKLAKEYNATCILLHMPKVQKNMPINRQTNPIYSKSNQELEKIQQDPKYSNGVIEEVVFWFEKKIQIFNQSGIKKIILDPGIGFGKTIDQNIKIIKSIYKFRPLGLPLLLGISRKSFMMRILNKNADQLLPATIAMNTMAILGGVDYIRVHDVEEHKDVCDLLSYYKQPLPIG